MLCGNYVDAANTVTTRTENRLRLGRHNEPVCGRLGDKSSGRQTFELGDSAGYVGVRISVSRVTVRVRIRRGDVCRPNGLSPRRQRIPTAQYGGAAN